MVMNSKALLTPGTCDTLILCPKHEAAHLWQYGTLQNPHDKLDANMAVMAIFTVSSYKDNQSWKADG